MVASVRAVPAFSRPGRVAAALFATAVLSGTFVWFRIAIPLLTLNDEAVASHREHLALVLWHAIGGTVMLFAGAAALYIGSTRRFFRGHKVFGYSYLFGGAMSALAALYLVLSGAHSSVGIGAATGSLAAAWLVTASMAFRAILNRRFEAHREWMIRSYVLTWSFVFCRIVQESASFKDAGGEVVAAVIWATWVVPLVFCEVALQWDKGSKVPRRTESSLTGV